MDVRNLDPIRKCSAVYVFYETSDSCHNSASNHRIQAQNHINKSLKLEELKFKTKIPKIPLK